MVLILDSSSEHGAHIWSKPGISICYIWLNRTIRQIRFFCKEKNTLLHTCATCSELPSYRSTMKAALSEQNIWRRSSTNILNIWIEKLDVDSSNQGCQGAFLFQGGCKLVRGSIHKCQMHWYLRQLPKGLFSWNAAYNVVQGITIWTDLKPRLSRSSFISRRLQSA